MHKDENNKKNLIACQGEIDDIWYLDNGASKHIIDNKHFLSQN